MINFNFTVTEEEADALINVIEENLGHIKSNIKELESGSCHSYSMQEFSLEELQAEEKRLKFHLALYHKIQEGEKKVSE